jgi:PAS domain S-box-containing protein
MASTSPTRAGALPPATGLTDLLLEPGTILAVADDAESLELLSGILRPAGYTVRPAGSGELALAAVVADPPELVLLDVRLPGMDGLEVCRRLKLDESTRSIPVVLMSSPADVKEWVTGLRLGAADYISKPLQSAELLTRVRTHLALHRAQASLEQQAEAALRRLSARHEAILNEIPDIVMEVDANRVYTWANRVGLGFFGDDVIGKEAAYYFVGEQDTYQRVEPLFAGDTSTFYVESWQRRKDGERRLLAWWCRALKDATGRVTGALSTARDITEHSRAEATVREQMAELQRWYEATLDREGRILELKQEVNALLAKAGEPPRYAST